MKYRNLGKTSLKVSVIGLGTHQLSGEWAKQFSAEEVQELLTRAHNLGINFIDTAECYGDHSVEASIGNAIKKQRKNWIIATKFGHKYVNFPQKSEAWSATEVRKQLDASLKALQTNYIDLYQFHSGNNKDFDNIELWEMLHEQVRLGRIKWLGVSLAADLMLKNDLHQLLSATELNLGTIQVVYNRLQRKAEEEILPFCIKHQIGVLARVPLAKGFLGGNYKPGAVFPKNDVRSSYSAEFNNQQLEQVEILKRTELPPGKNMAQWALAWCLKHPAVSSVIVGCKNIPQLELNAAAADMDVNY